MSMMVEPLTAEAFDLVPSIDLLDGEVVRLMQGDFQRVTSYGKIDEALERWAVPYGSRLHIVDLNGSRRGVASDAAPVRMALQRDLRVQVGGGIRSTDDVKRWLDLGVSRVVVGTLVAGAPSEFERLVSRFGAEKLLPALDLRDGVVRTDGWEKASSRSLKDILLQLEDLQIPEILVTDISVDGTMRGPAFATYRELAQLTGASILASGGVGSLGDLRSLSRHENVSGVIIGRALHEKRFSLDEGRQAIRARGIPERVIPCLDVRNGRVVKGTKFLNLRDAGNPAELAGRYEEEGADELVVLDVSATQEERQASLLTIREISERLFIPLTVGGGVRSVEDFRRLLQAGADRVAINTAAVQRPDLISECAAEFGVQAVVVAVDARAVPGGYDVVVRSGTEQAPFEVVNWCREAERRGAGEILLTSIDRDGTAEGFDLDLLRAATSAVRIGVIASGGAGKIEHFRDAIEVGAARAVLAASLFHDRRLSIGEVKDALEQNGIQVRR